MFHQKPSTENTTNAQLLQTIKYFRLRVVLLTVPKVSDFTHTVTERNLSLAHTE